METSTFTLNQAAEGGAIDYRIDNQNDPPTSFNPSLIVNQDYFSNNSPPTRLRGNGGAIFSSVESNAGTAQVSITNSTFLGNGAAIGAGTVVNGGGVDIVQDTSGTGSTLATLTNDTFFKNTATAEGGGLALFLTNTGTGTNTANLTSLTVDILPPFGFFLRGCEIIQLHVR